jgi:hypothetical protein
MLMQASPCRQGVLIPLGVTIQKVTTNHTNFTNKRQKVTNNLKGLGENKPVFVIIRVIRVIRGESLSSSVSGEKSMTTIAELPAFCDAIAPSTEALSCKPWSSDGDAASRRPVHLKAGGRKSFRTLQPSVKLPTSAAAKPHLRNTGNRQTDGASASPRCLGEERTFCRGSVK